MSNWLIIGIAVVVIGAVIYMKVGGASGYEKRAMTVDQMKAENALIVDIRRPDEWKETGVIEGARLVTFKDAEGFLKAIGKDLTPGRPLVLVCRSGNRSSAAAAALVGKVTGPIISANGGMSALIAAGYKTVRPSK